MPSFIITEEEMEAMHELPWVAQLAYLRAIRPHLNYSTGRVGESRKISRRSIIEELTVPGVRGRHSSAQEAPSEKTVRHALDVLVGAGLLRRVGDMEALVFELPLSSQPNSVSGMRGRSGADEGPGMSGRDKSSNGADLCDMKGRSWAGVGMPMRGPHQYSVVSVLESTANAVLVPEPADAELDDVPDRVTCPTKKIVAAYNHILPELPPMRSFPDQAIKMLRARVREDPEKRQDVAWWEGFFGYVRTCPFLMGSETGWQADLIWLVRPTNFAKTINGNYEAKKQRFGR